MKNFAKSTAFKVLVGIALFLAGMMIYSASTGAASIPETFAGTVVTPLQSLGTAIAGGFYDFVGIFTDSGRLRTENAELTEEIERLRNSQAELDELRRLNDSYKEYLGLKEQHPDFSFAAARVISSDSADKYGNFTINCGSLSGVKVRDPVVSGDMLVGMVYKVGLNYANVRTILDPETQVTAYISRNNAGGITGGSAAPASGTQLRMNYLSREKGLSVTPDDYVMTSGLGGIFPAGLHIGKVESVSTEASGTTMFAVVNPFADINKLDYVSVIISFAGQGEF